MKKTTILFLIIISCITLSAQYFGKSFVLDEEIPPDQTKEYVASEYIDMQYGFWAHPDAENYVHTWIDPMMDFPPHDGEWGGPPDNNGGGGVGTLPGNLLVSPTGASVYSIPVEAPEGIAGLTPNLKFVYNSQAGDGIMGPGWSISGLSKIARVPYTYYYNGYTGSVALSGEDQLMLDGNYLRKTDEGKFRTEMETFSLIEQKGAEINDGFIVRKKNGLVYEYGTTENAKYYLQASGNPIAWYLAKIKDLNGNYIEFHYINDKDNGSFYPDYIRYGGNEDKNQVPFYEISFNYMVYEREDTPKKYFTNPDNPEAIYSRITKQLSDISITYIPTGTKIKIYKLTYTTLGEFGIRYLTGIHPSFDYDTKKTLRWLNETKFDWDISEYELTTEEKDLWLKEYTELFVQESIFAANFDDEPRSDLLHVSLIETINKYYIRAYLNRSFYGSNNFNFGFSNPSSSEDYSHFFSDKPVVIFLAPGDFTGDGIDEILCVFKKGMDRTEYYFTIGHFDFGGSGEYIESQEFGPCATKSATPPKFIIGDFSGNGYNDLGVILRDISQGGYSRFNFILSYKNEPLSRVIKSGYNPYEAPDKVLVGDFNGNGKTELLSIGYSRSYVISLLSNNEQISIIETTDDFCDIKYKNTDIVASDFNNDAKTDVLMLYPGMENNWLFYFSFGKGLFVKNEPISVEPIGYPEQTKFAVDVNGDHYGDICRIKEEVVEEGGQTWHKYYRKDFLIKPNHVGVQVIQQEYPEPVAVYQQG